MSKHKLLLADDSITIQKVVNLTFADEGIEVISVGDGNSAMEKFDEFTPDLVMADINMPGLNGYEICERIRQNERTSRIPVILLVGAFEPFDEQEAQRVGANDFLTKPFQSIRQLVSKVSDLLESTASDEETAQPPGSFEDTLDMDEGVSEPEQLGDAGMDDEMIQANEVGNFQFDETRKFESRAEPEFAEPETASFGEEPQLAANENEYSAQTEEPEANRAASALELDEMNLLELPPRKSFSAAAASQPVFEDNFIPAVETIETQEAETAETETVETAETSQAEEPAVTGSNLSPEMIDAIAAKVVEKISDKVIREIAWEVVPQMTDLIVKRLAEEKLKE